LSGGGSPSCFLLFVCVVDFVGNPWITCESYVSVALSFFRLFFLMKNTWSRDLERWWNKGCVWFSLWKMLLLLKSITPTKQIKSFPEVVAITEYNFRSTAFDPAFGFLFFFKWLEIKRCFTTISIVVSSTKQLTTLSRHITHKKFFHSLQLTIIFLQLTYEPNNKPKILIVAGYRSLISYGVSPTRSTTLVHFTSWCFLLTEVNILTAFIKWSL
jgi:hypothetical protein